LTKSVAVLISGRGSNMQALVEDSRRLPSPFSVTRVICDQPAAAGIDLARGLGVEVDVVAAPKGMERAAYDVTLAATLERCAPDLIVLAGFMRILSATFVDRFAGSMLNIHPSLLPVLPGLHTHRKVLAQGHTEHGVTVHFVTPELDGGPRILQARIDVRAADTETTLAQRVAKLEHRIYPLAVRWFCEGRLKCRNGAAWLDDKRLDEPVQYDEA
jgi:phosphoribosylglycinamide formyltransferase 1